MRNDTRTLPNNVRAIRLRWGTRNRPGFITTLHYAWERISGPETVPWGLFLPWLQFEVLPALEEAASKQLGGLAYNFLDNHGYTHPEAGGATGVPGTGFVEGDEYPSSVAICFSKRSAVMKPWTGGRMFMPCVSSGHVIAPGSSTVKVDHPKLEAARLAMLKRLEVRPPPENEEFDPAGDFVPVIWRPKTQSYLRIEAVTINKRLAVIRRRRWIDGFSNT